MKLRQQRYWPYASISVRRQNSIAFHPHKRMVLENYTALLCHCTKATQIRRGRKIRGDPLIALQHLTVFAVIYVVLQISGAVSHALLMAVLLLCEPSFTHSSHTPFALCVSAANDLRLHIICCKWPAWSGFLLLCATHRENRSALY